MKIVTIHRALIATSMQLGFNNGDLAHNTVSLQRCGHATQLVSGEEVARVTENRKKLKEISGDETLQVTHGDQV